MSHEYPDWVKTESEQRLHDDFRVFLFHLWKHLGLPAPTKRQYAIAQWVANGPQRRMVQAYRGAGKTWITCAYALWRLYRNPNERVKIVSANEDKALENGVFIRRLIDEVPELRFLRPKQGSSDRDSTLKFDVGPATAHPTPSVSCVGITGQLTGGRATLLISDDVEVPGNSETEKKRERLAHLVTEYDSLVVPEGFDIIYLGTPQSQQTIYLTVRNRGYACRIWPVRFPDQAQIEVYAGGLAPDIQKDLDANPGLVGKSTEPTRFTDIDLEGRHASQGAEFLLQFMLDTSLSDAERYPLKTAMLICLDVDNELAPGKLVWSSLADHVIDPPIDNVGFNGDRLYRPMHIADTMLPYSGRILVIDPSGRGKDETAYVVLLHMAGMLFMPAVGGVPGYDEGSLQTLAEVAKAHKVNTVLVESNYGDGMFSALFKPVLGKVHPCAMEEVLATGQKERRIIDDLLPVLAQHRLVMDIGAARKDVQAGVNSLLYQLTHITRDRGALRRDDRVDALAHGCRFFRDQLQRDAQSAEDQHLQKLRDQQMRDFRGKHYRQDVSKPRYASTNRGTRR